MKKVHAILRGKTNDIHSHPIVISFIQHGTKEDGFVYENICPFCAETLEKVTVHPEAEASIVFKRLQVGMEKHIWLCSSRGSDRLFVEQTTKPLGTEKLIKEH
jgi:hypothetical protein